MNWNEKQLQLKAELAELSEAELRASWQQNYYTLQDMEREADERGDHMPGDDYFGSDLSEEMELINEILRERGLPEEERPVRDEEDEEQ